MVQLKTFVCEKAELRKRYYLKPHNYELNKCRLIDPDDHEPNKRSNL